MASLEVTRNDEAVVASLAGDVDLAASEDITPARLAALGERGALVLNLREVTFLDSTGMRLIFSVRRRLARRGHRFAVVLPRDERVRQIFALIDAADALNLFESVEDAQLFCAN
jgi:anti-sigma B factor antagonist